MFIRDLLNSHEYVDFLIGKDEDFDQIVSSDVKRMQRVIRDDNSSLTWVLPYPTAELENNYEDYENYYDNIEICEESCKAHFKGTMQMRNKIMVDRADLVVCFIDHFSGGAYQTIKYAEEQNKKIINITKEDMY